jgi:hypothetical protein
MSAERRFAHPLVTDFLKWIISNGPLRSEFKASLLYEHVKQMLIQNYNYRNTNKIG